jgi:two-component SAPR family response regulator
MRNEIRKELDKAMRIQNVEEKHVKIHTIPHFAVTIDGKPFYLGREKSLELFAFIVDKGERGTTAGECIASLWPDRPNDSATQSLFRMTYKRLLDALEKAGAGDILMSKNSRRFICVDKVECDLYKILDGDKMEAQKYNGQYLDEYSWAESRNGQLYRMIFYKDIWD